MGLESGKELEALATDWFNEYFSADFGFDPVLVLVASSERVSVVVTYRVSAVVILPCSGLVTLVAIDDEAASAGALARLDNNGSYVNSAASGFPALAGTLTGTAGVIWLRVNNWCGGCNCLGTAPPDSFGAGNTWHTEDTDLTGDATRCMTCVGTGTGDPASWKSGVRAPPLDKLLADHAAMPWAILDCAVGCCITTPDAH